MDEGNVDTMTERMVKGHVTLDDYLAQAKMIKTMGSMPGISMRDFLVIAYPLAIQV
jgi:signal recognition particle GTPase